MNAYEIAAWVLLGVGTGVAIRQMIREHVEHRRYMAKARQETAKIAARAQATDIVAALEREPCPCCGRDLLQVCMGLVLGKR